MSFFSTNSGFNTIFPIYAIENNDEEPTESIEEDNADSTDQLKEQQSTESIEEDNADSTDQLNDFGQELTSSDMSDGNDTMVDLTGDIEQKSSNQESNLSTFSTENNQKLIQMANQIFNSSDLESQKLQHTQQIMGQLVQQISSISNKNIVESLNSISSQLENDQSGELRNALSIIINEYYGENVNLINQIIQQISSQTTIENDISAILIQVSNQIVNNFFKNKIIKNIDSDIDSDIKIVKLIQKDICQTQSDSIQLKGKILAKEVIVIADYTPCIIVDGSITFNIPDNPRLKFVILSLNTNENHESAMIDKTQIELIGGDNELYRINLNNEMNGRDPITKDNVVLTKINGLAFYNSGSELIEFNPGDSLAISAVLNN